MSASERWRRDLQAWALPQVLLDQADESPYGWSPKLWKRRSRMADEQSEVTRTVEIVRGLSTGGSILDIGAGRGRASLPLAREGRRVFMVEPNDDMRQGATQDAAGLDVHLVAGRWPDVAESVPLVDVAMCAHVVYDVADIEPFIVAMNSAAERGVVIEMTPRHPWSSLTPYYQALHDLDRPAGPTWEDLVEVIGDVTRAAPEAERWSRAGGMWYESMAELVAHQAKALVLNRPRHSELEELLRPNVVETEGRLQLEPVQRELVTVWWQTD